MTRLRAAPALLLVLGCLAACSAGGGTEAVRPAPGTTTAPAPPPPQGPRLGRAHELRVPDGFRAEVYARGLNHPTAMAFGPDGLLYVTEDVGSLASVAPGTHNPRRLLHGLATPLGLVWTGRTLYVSEQGRVERWRLGRNRLVGRTVVVSDLPFGLHQQDNVVLGPDGRLYLGSGSTCNACAEADPRSAAILSPRPDGSDLRVVARGLRNAFGLAFRPGTDELYATVNGRDDLPDTASNEPAEMLILVEQGANYGWPDCYPSWLERRLLGDCAGVTPPVAYLEPHSSADGLAFVAGDAFPARFRDGVFVALWGQYGREEHGRRVDFVPLPSGEARSFATGFSHPLALAFDAQGALLVSDWERGVVYRIRAL